MKKPKRKYKVYYVGTGFGCYAKNYCREYVGETYAVSEAQACNNVRNRLKSKDFPNGPYSTEVFGDILDEGEVWFSFEAEES